MFMIRCILLLLTLTCNLTNNTHQNQLPFLTKNFNQRIKRLWSDKSSKSHSKKEKLLKNNRLFTDELLFTNYEGNQLRNLPKKQYTQQEVAEIQRILSKAEDDYYGILHIKKHATWDEILIAHRKLSLRVHPDKINAPGAKEATQRLNKARAELSKKFRNPNQSTNRLYHVFYCLDTTVSHIPQFVDVDVSTGQRWNRYRSSKIQTGSISGTGDM